MGRGGVGRGGVGCGLSGALGRAEVLVVGGRARHRTSLLLSLHPMAPAIAGSLGSRRVVSSKFY